MKRANVYKGLAAAISAATLVGVAGCGSSNSSESTKSSGAQCAPYKVYGDLSGKKISVYTIWVDQEGDATAKAFSQFESCTGAKVSHEGSRDLATQLPVRIKSGSAPDIAVLPQPGLVKSMVDTGKVAELSKDALANVSKYYSKDWQDYASVGGKVVSIPVDANAKSFIWYSPKKFKEKGYKVPQTWDEMVSLTKTIAKDNKGDTGVKPWSVGLEGGTDSGWPGTDWLEDAVLRFTDGDTYNQWVAHKIPFNDPKIVSAFKEVGKLLKNPDYVSGGFGDTKSIASTSWQDAGNSLIDGKGYLMHMALFYQSNYESSNPDISISPDGDAWAFPMPSLEKDKKNMLGGGDFAVAFSDKPEVQQFEAFLASPEYANARAKAMTGWITANTGLDESLLKPIDKLAYTSLTDKNTTFRFDGSDLMPAEVGTGIFFKEMISYFGQGKSEQDVLDTIEKSWPTGK